MKLYNSFKLYKKNIHKDRLLIFICIVVFTFCILLDSFVSSQGEGINISELQLTYNNLNLYKQWIYISICTVVTLNLLSFSDNYLYVLRVGTKDKLWNLVIHHILVSNFMISLYLVIFSYLSGLLFSNKLYIQLNKTLMLLIALVFLYTIGLSLFSLIAFTAKIITGNKNIAYLLIFCILVPEVLNNSNSLILYDISFNFEYITNISLAFFNIIKLGGILILLIELGRFFYIKNEIYNTKGRIINGK